MVRITSAIHIVADLETPTRQCTKTGSFFVRPSSSRVSFVQQYREYSDVPIKSRQRQN